MAPNHGFSGDCDVALSIDSFPKKDLADWAVVIMMIAQSAGRFAINELPEDVLQEIMSRLPDARDLLNSAAVCKIFKSSFQKVKTVRFTCRLPDITRNRSPGVPIQFKDNVTKTLSHRLTNVENLRLEVEDDLQTRNMKDDDIERNSLWLSDKHFVATWITSVKYTLKSLTIIDYGQQAIFHATPLLRLLSTECKQLETLELRNMYLDSKEIEPMNKVTMLTLRCVKLTENGLGELNKCMPRLETLTLVTVVGLKEAEFTSTHLKVLCLGLATRVKFVKLNVGQLQKLQLKMACPEKLIVNAPNLECLAVCMDKRETSVVQFENVKRLRELLMGASEFTTLTELSSRNPDLEKMFLDVPCMAFEDSGNWKGVLSTVNTDIPQMGSVQSCCPNLQTLSVGPGLWYAFENKNPGEVGKSWPALKRLIVHLIILFPEHGEEVHPSVTLLSTLVKAIPSLSDLEVYVHLDSKREFTEFRRLEKEFPHLRIKCDSWKKGLRFECFSF